MKSKILHFLMKCSGAFGYLLQYGCIAHCVLEYGGDFVVCSGPSMEPSIHTNDVVITEHISVIRGLVHKGDIVIAHCPTNPNRYICKRVTALEGDPVTNNMSNDHMIVPRGHIWLEGDNSYNSTDSRTYGAVPYGLLRSRVMYKIWPLYDVTRFSRSVER